MTSKEKAKPGSQETVKAPTQSGTSSQTQQLADLLKLTLSEVGKTVSKSIKEGMVEIKETMNTQFETLLESMQGGEEEMDTTGTGLEEAADGDEEPPRKKAKESPFEALRAFAGDISTQEQVSVGVDETLAENVTKVMRERPGENFEKEVYEKVLRPENCDGLQKIKVNQQIWDRISVKARTYDVGMQRAQTAIVKTATVMTIIYDAMLRRSAEDEEINGWLHDINTGMKCIGAANVELVQRRREAMKHDIAPEYRHLCSPNIPFTDQLFGENVSKQIKEISEDNRLTGKAMSRGRGRGMPGGRGGRGRGRGQGHFGGRGRGGRGRGNSNSGSGRGKKKSE